ncbi:MAG: ChrR family anti-sigma-E factor [Pararhizobium sp.]
MVREHIDTIDSLMARYVAGSLPAPARVLVESHLALKSERRTFVRDLEALAGDALEATPPAVLSASRERMLDAVFRSPPPVGSPIRIAAATDQGFPAPLKDFIGFDIDAVPWRTKLPGFKEYDVGDIDGCHVSLFWIRPGRSIPTHTHKGCEISLVLDGAFSDTFGRYGRGDISVADESVEHRPVAEKERPCIAFAVVDAPLKLTGSFTQILRDILG